MKYPKVFFVALTALALAVWASPSLALEPIPKQDGFSGVIGAGANYFNFESNDIAKIAGIEVSDPRASSLSPGGGEEPESESSVLPSLNFDLRYTLGSSQTQFFLANTLFDLVKLDSFTELGVRQQFSDRSILSVGIVFSGMVEVYSDPYLQGVDRTETDRTATGVRLVYDKIMGTGFGLEVMARKIDIDQERSGVSLPLTPAQRGLLDRNATETSVGVQYAFMIDESQSIIPAVSFINYDADGDAMKNQRFQIEATYVFRSQVFDFALNAMFASASYDETNPVFNKEEEDTVYGVFAKGVYKNLLDVSGLDLVGQAGYEVKDADIDFLNSQATLAGLILQYRF
jgi:hypothetical protein